MKTVYVPEESLTAWDQLRLAAAEAKLSASALLLTLVRAYLDGKITVKVPVIEVADAEA